MVKLIIKLQSRFGVVEEIKDEAHSDDFYKEVLINPLTDINKKSKQELEEFKPFDSDTFVNYRFEEEVVISSEYYLNVLTYKVN